MEPIKKVYYPKKYRIKKLIFPFFAITITSWAVLPIFFNEESWKDIAILFIFYAFLMTFFICLALLIIKPILAFSPDSVYFFHHRILFDEIETITISKKRQIILFTLKHKNSKAMLINNAQIFIDYQLLSLSRDELLWLYQNKNPKNIVLYNFFGFDAPLEEILNYFPSTIPLIEDKD